MTPTIDYDEDAAGDMAIYRLRVPHGWMLATRWPRLALSWWLLRMIWQWSGCL